MAQGTKFLHAIWNYMRKVKMSLPPHPVFKSLLYCLEFPIGLELPPGEDSTCKLKSTKKPMKLDHVALLLRTVMLHYFLFCHMYFTSK